MNHNRFPMIGRIGPTWLTRVRSLHYAIAVLLAVLIAMSSASAFAEPPISITACGKIAKAGLYEVDSDLFASSASDCLVITASNVSLNLNGFRLNGPTSGVGTTSGVGIHVMKTASKVFIEGNGATIQFFGVGLQIDAAGALADNFIVLSNTDAGVLLNRVQQADLSNFSATSNLNDGVRISGGGFNVLQMPTITGNGRYGVWAQSSSHNSIGNFMVQNNVQAGIYIGCSSTGPQGSCPRGAAVSNYNYMFSGIAGITSSGVQHYGVAIDLKNNFNRVVNVAAWQNDQLDLFDANQDCAGNYWFAEPTIGLVAPRNCIN